MTLRPCSPRSSGRHAPVLLGGRTAVNNGCGYDLPPTSARSEATIWSDQNHVSRKGFVAGFRHVTCRNRLKRLNIRETPRLALSADRRPDKPQNEKPSARVSPRIRRLRRPPYGRMSSTCGVRGVTSGPSGAHTMFTSLRTPNSPGRYTPGSTENPAPGSISRSS